MRLQSTGVGRSPYDSCLGLDVTAMLVPDVKPTNQTAQLIGDFPSLSSKEPE